MKLSKACADFLSKMTAGAKLVLAWVGKSTKMSCPNVLSKGAFIVLNIFAHPSYMRVH